MSEKPGKGLMGWLGRQVGHVRSALKKEIGHKRLYRREDVQEQALPDKPKVKLRRTTIDEVIVEGDQ
jgi:hypothetical protein